MLPQFNSSRNKLFFFWNQEFLPRTDPGTLQLRNVPTELERRGDFSRSFDNNGNLIVIRDPSDGTTVPGQHHSVEPDRPKWAGAAERLPGAERRRPAAAIQLHVPERVRPAAQRPGPARRLERRLEHHVLFAPEFRLRGLQGRLGIRARTTPTGRSCRLRTRSTATVSSIPCSTLSARRSSLK